MVGAAFALVLAGCSTASTGKQTSPQQPGKPDAAKGAPDAPAPVKDAGAAPVCHGPGYTGSPSNQEFNHLSATVVDGDGKGIADLIAQACGTNICLNGTTSANGAVTINEHQSLTKPAFKYGGGEAYVRFALPLSGSTVDVDLGKQTTFAFDAPASGAELVPGKPAVSNGVTLTVSSDTVTIAPDPLDFQGPDLKKFRAVEVPVDKAPAAVDASLGFGMLVALTPAATVLCPAASLSVPNSPGWAAGTRVELFLHGVDIGEEWAPYGGWAKVSGGAVSADGMTIETDPDGGLPALSVVGIRLAK